ncbi:MAG: ABC transporter permease [Spirochaetaceae bacterium]|jgi:simple sugar transport system permease protein|nr:ABC transporter permease [Spirochaetaceae bacterium]
MMTEKIRGMMKTKVFGALIVLALLLAFNLFFTKNFFAITVKDGHLFGTVIDILNRGAPVMLLSMGMTLVIAATGGTDLSVGAVIAITAALVSRLIGGELVIIDGAQHYVSNTPMPLAVAGALLLAAALGLWNGALVAYGNIQPIVATLVLMVAGRGIAQLITDGQIITIYYRPFFFIGGGWFMGLPFAIFIVLFVFVMARFLTRKTALGLFIASVGGNAAASWYAGINEKAVKLFSFMFCGFCAGAAGLIICSNVKSADANNAGLNTELDAILAAVIGGTNMAGGKFSLSGSLVGALLIQTLTTTIYAFGVPPEVSLVVKALVVVLVCFIQSSAAERFFGAVAAVKIQRGGAA